MHLQYIRSRPATHIPCSLTSLLWLIITIQSLNRKNDPNFINYWFGELNRQIPPPSTPNTPNIAMSCTILTLNKRTHRISPSGRPDYSINMQSKEIWCRNTKRTMKTATDYSDQTLRFSIPTIPLSSFMIHQTLEKLTESLSQRGRKKKSTNRHCKKLEDLSGDP